MIQGKTNAFNGFEVDPDRLPACAEEFRDALPAALAAWQQRGLSLVWLKVPPAKAFIIPIAVEHGFVFHHSQTQYAMLTCALEPGAFIPNYATHYVGAGGVVIDDASNVLVVNERYRRNREQPFWKMPGGLLEPGEHLRDGVIREVREETGIDTAFQHLVSLWHGHTYQFGMSGIYMVCRLRPLNHDIQICEQEIDDCVWMPLQDYLTSPYVADFNRAIVEAAVSPATLQARDMPGYPRPEMHEFFFPPPTPTLRVKGMP